MSHLAKYYTGSIDKLLNDIEKHSIGMDEWFHRFGTLHQTESNYPPYNLIKESNTEFRLEVALAGFKKKELSVYTENNKLFVVGTKETDTSREYVHRGLSNRAFTRAWTISDDVEVRNVEFEDGLLTVSISRIIPEHQKKRTWI